MNVNDLIIKLGALSPELEVWSSSDEEGNRVFPLRVIFEEWLSPDKYEPHLIHPDDYSPEDYPKAVRIVLVGP